MQIKNKEEELKLSQDKINSLNQTIESLQLNLNKEIAESSRLEKELSKMTNQSKLWASEKAALERQASHSYYKLT